MRKSISTTMLLLALLVPLLVACGGGTTAAPTTAAAPTAAAEAATAAPAPTAAAEATAAPAAATAAPEATAAPAAGGNLKIGMVTDIAKLGDKSFNDSAWRFERSIRPMRLWSHLSKLGPLRIRLHGIPWTWTGFYSFLGYQRAQRTKPFKSAMNFRCSRKIFGKSRWL